MGNLRRIYVPFTHSARIVCYTGKCRVGDIKRRGYVMSEIDEYIAEAMSCPKCRENRPDYLVWLDGEETDWVECQSCGEKYSPLECFV